MIDDFHNQIGQKTDQELIDIFLNDYQYQDEFAQLAIRELEERGVDLTSYRLRKQHKDAYILERLEEGRSGHPAYIVLGFVSALLGGFLGIVAGYIYCQSKHKELGDGTHWVYDLKTRNLGTGMMVLGIIVLILSIILLPE